MIRAAAWTFLVLSLAVCAFQAALALGVPWGEFTMGGRWPGRLPAAGRWAAAGSLVLVAGFAAVVAARAGLALAALHPLSRRLVWAVVALLALSTTGNAATPSARERALWLPVVAVMLGSAVIVARGGRKA